VIDGCSTRVDNEHIGVLRLSVALACVVLATAASVGAADDPYAALLAPSGTCGAPADQLDLDLATAETAMLCLTNYARAQSGLPALHLNAPLDNAGQAKLAADVSCGEFTHTPCGRPFDSVFSTYVQGATSYQIGENIAWGTGNFGTPRGAMNGWLHSDGHRANILTAAYTEIGIGYSPGQTFQGYSGATLWSQEFGVRSPAPTETVAVTPHPAAAPKATPKQAKKHRRRVRKRVTT
jgi:uncharacterized protein YkwD